MHRLISIISTLVTVLLISTLCQPAQAQPRDPRDLPTVSAARAQEALQQARSLFSERADARRTRAAALARGRAATPALRDLWRALPSLRGADRTAAKRLLARPTPGESVFGYAFVLPASSTTVACSTNFCIHYATTGQNRASATQVQAVASTLESVRSKFVGPMGYRAPVSDASWASSLNRANPDAKFDVFLGDIGSRGIYGYCTLDSGRLTPYCALDNDFSSEQFPGRPLNSLRVTAAHEFFHAIQFAYDANEDAWLMEGSSVWAEERVYPGINDYLQYVRGDSVITRPGTPVDQDSVHNLRVYASMLFFEHLTQTLGVFRMRQVWEEAARGSTYSLQAVRRVVDRASNWRAFINRFAVWNSQPPGVGYADRSRYPGGRFATTRKLGWDAKRTMSTTFRRGHLASGAVRLVPARASTQRQRVRITVNGPSTWRGSVAAVQIRRPHQRTTWRQVRLNAYGNATITQPFGRGRISSVVLTAANSSTRMRSCGAYYSAPVSYSCGGFGVYNDLWKISARVIR